MGTLDRTDPLLRLLDPEGMPDSFILLPDDEQRWRGRIFIMHYWYTHSPAFAWWQALRVVTPEQDAEDKAFALAVPDERLAASLRGVIAEQRMAADGTLEEYYRKNEGGG